MAAFLDYNTIGLSVFTVLLCIVLNEIGIRSVCLAQWNGEPHPGFIPHTRTVDIEIHVHSQPDRDLYSDTVASKSLVLSSKSQLY